MFTAALGCLHGGTNGCRHQIECFQHLRQIMASEVYHQVAEAEFLILLKWKNSP
jgi:hypothetical protein